MSCKKIRVLALAPFANPAGVGESYSAFRIAKELSKLCDLTVLAQSPNASALIDGIPNANVIAWPDVSIFKRLGRVDSMLKPGFAVYGARVRKWLKTEGANKSFDIIHQLAPLALRYPCPVPSCIAGRRVIGPLAGSLPTPEGLKRDTAESFMVRLRALDNFRMRWDPFLRRTYREADLILGAAPYVRTLLPNCFSGRFEVLSEVGTEGIPRELREPEKRLDDGTVRILFVGRLVGTKGVGLLLDAMNQLNRGTPVRLDIVGDGPLREQLVAQSERLGLNHQVCFRGRCSRAEVDDYYRNADIFALPSFREPSGNAVIEAMSWGLPVIVVDYGGPAHTVTDGCGIKVPVGSREQMVSSLASAIKMLLRAPQQRREMGARATVRAREYSWQKKGVTLAKWYSELLFR